MPVESIRGVVEAAIQRASNATGVDFGFLLGTARRESRFDPNAQAPTSSAAGLFQFVDQTWLSTLKRHGARHGYARYADLIVQGSDGRYRVSGGTEARRAVMDLRLDPHAASLMAGELASDHAAYLRGRIGREPTAGELYAAHFLGPQGSARLIETVRTNPGANAVSLFPDAAGANRPIFYRQGRPATVAEVYANLTSAPGGSRPGAAPEAAPTPVDDGAFIHYASARRSERVQAQQSLVDMVLRGPQGGDDAASSAYRATNSMFSTEMLQMMADDRERQRRGR